MAVTLNGAPLEFAATVDLNAFAQATATMNKELQAVAQRQAENDRKAQQAQREYAQTIISTGMAFRNLDGNIQAQMRSLTGLQAELQKVKQAQSTLAERKELGTIGTDTANSSMAALVAKEKELSAAIAKVSQDMQTSDAIMRAASGSLVQKTLQLEALKKEYYELSEADRQAAGVGGGLLDRIRGLDTELRAVSGSFLQVQASAVGSINARSEALSKLKSDYSALSEADRNSDFGRTMLANLQAVDAEVRTLNNSFQAAQQNAVGSLNEKVGMLSRLRSEYAALAETDRNSKAGKALRDNITGLDREVQKINASFNETESLATKVAAALGAYGALTVGTNFVKDVVRVRGEFQQLEVAFNTMLGSKEKADKLMQEVTQFAATTPFELTEVAGAAKQLLAFGVDADKVKDTLRSLGDVSAGIGAPLGEIAYLYGTIKTAGRAEGEDIKQFAQRGIPIYDELAKVLKTNVENVKDLVSAGKVGFPEIEKAFQNMTAEGSKFGGLMEAQSHTLTGQLSNLSDAWNQMLNEIGKSGEGVFASSISAATTLVGHYQDVIDVIKVAVAMYGTYKAATLATAAVQAIQTAATQGQTVATLLYTGATRVANVAAKALDATLGKNPWVFLATAVAGMVAAMVAFADETTKVTKATELLSDAQEEANGKFAEQEGAIRGYISELQNQNLAEQTRLDAYNKLKEIAPDIIGQLTFQASKTADLTDATNVYIATLRQRLDLEAGQEAYKNAKKQREEKFAAAEAAAIAQRNRIEQTTRIQGAAASEVTELTEYGKAVQAFRDADRELVAVETQIKTSIGGTSEAIKARIEQLKQEQQLFPAASARYKEMDGEIQSLTASLAKLPKDAPAAAAGRTLKQIEADIKAAKGAQQLATDKPSFDKYSEKIKELEEEKKRITGATKQELKAEDALQTKINALLEKRKDLLQEIADWQREASQTGMVKELSEQDKINQKWDERIRKAIEYNETVQAFNKKNGTKVAQLGQTDIGVLNGARQTELANAGFKKDAADYKAHLDELKAIFEKYEDAKKTIGQDSADQLYAREVSGFDSFGDYLTAQLIVLQRKVSAGVATVADQLELQEVAKQVVTASNEATKKQQEDLVRVVQATASAAQKRKQIDEQYARDVQLLRGKYSGDDLAQRLAARARAYQDDTDALKDQAVRQTDIYKLLSEDTIRLTRDQIKQRIKLLEDYLKKTKDLTPQMAGDIQGGIEKLRQLLDSTSALNTAEQKQLAEKLTKVRDNVVMIADGFRETAAAVRDTNAGLADTLETTSQLLDIAASGLQAAIGALSGDVKSAIGGTISYYKGIYDFVFTAPKKSAAEAQKRLDEFQSQLLAGEEEINRLHRERDLLQAKATAGTYARIKAERDLLEDQKRALRDQYNSLLQQLQAQTALVGLSTQKTGGIFGIGRKTKVVEIRESLAGKSYDELEQLFLSGQLTDKAKELFEALQKIKNEGADVDKMLEENKREAEQIFTGTTSDSIADTIAQGFANGLNSAADFASSFEDLMRQALINSLKYKYLEAPLQAFYEQFAAAAQSGDELTSLEIADLQGQYNTILTNAQQQIQQIQQIAGMGITNGAARGSAATLTGAIKGMTEQQADLLAAQFGGLRLTALDLVTLSRSSLVFQEQTANNTGELLRETRLLRQKFDRYETGASQIKVNI